MARFLATLLVLLTGCYQSHERADAGPARVDASRPIGPRDAGRPRDVGPDAEVPLPREMPIDPGPGGRPSDDPEADEWEDEPGLDPESPCCEPIGPPVDIPFNPTVAWGGVSLEWSGDGWGVLYTDIERRAAFQELDRDGQRIGGIRRYDVQGMGGRLEWADGRFAIVIAREGSGPQDNVLALADRRGVLATGWTDLELGGLGARVARLAYLDRWIVASAGNGAPVAARELDGESRLVGRAEVSPTSGERAVIAGLKSRVVVFWPDGGGVHARVLTPPIADGGFDTVTVLPALGEDHDRLAATRSRDRAIVMTNRFSEWFFAAYDPFVHETVVRELTLLPEVIRRAVTDLTSLDVPGLVAGCFNTADGDLAEIDHVELRLFTSDGEEAGLPVRIAAAELETSCAVGSDGERVFLAWTHERVVRVQGFQLRR